MSMSVPWKSYITQFHVKLVDPLPEPAISRFTGLTCPKCPLQLKLCQHYALASPTVILGQNTVRESQKMENANTSYAYLVAINFINPQPIEIQNYLPCKSLQPLQSSRANLMHSPEVTPALSSSPLSEIRSFEIETEEEEQIRRDREDLEEVARKNALNEIRLKKAKRNEEEQMSQTDKLEEDVF
ncbi:hypothetical protein DFH28DRAFT_924721 [Melampsora americana]|nr:hypothetical protein DFH28DRAFT_924721 [Melampsora americana]